MYKMGFTVVSARQTGCDASMSQVCTALSPGPDTLEVPDTWERVATALGRQPTQRLSTFIKWGC